MSRYIIIKQNMEHWIFYFRERILYLSKTTLSHQSCARWPEALRSKNAPPKFQIQTKYSVMVPSLLSSHSLKVRQDTTSDVHSSPTWSLRMLDEKYSGTWQMNSRSRLASLHSASSAEGGQSPIQPGNYNNRKTFLKLRWICISSRDAAVSAWFA